jgi:hypothetical protein
VTRTIDTTKLRDNDVYYVVYKIAGSLVFRTVGPLVAILVLNAFLIRALHEARRRHQQLATSSGATHGSGSGGGISASSKKRRSSSRHRENITLMLVAVVSVFIVCQLPDLGLRIGVAAVGESAQSVRVTASVNALAVGPKPAAAPPIAGVPSIGGGTSSQDFIRYVNSITNVLMALNSAVNFLIYCLVGKKFRRIFIDMFFGGRRSCCCCCCRSRSRGGAARGLETLTANDGAEPTEFGRCTVTTAVRMHHRHKLLPPPATGSTPASPSWQRLQPLPVRHSVSSVDCFPSPAERPPNGKDGIVDNDCVSIRYDKTTSPHCSVSRDEISVDVEQTK